MHVLLLTRQRSLRRCRKNNIDVKGMLYISLSGGYRAFLILKKEDVCN